MSVSLLFSFNLHGAQLCVYSRNNVVFATEVFFCVVSNQELHRENNELKQANTEVRGKLNNLFIYLFLLNRRILVYTFYLINICLSLSDDTNRVILLDP